METQIRIEHLISLADQYINCQLNRVLHHPQFQVLESGWRGVFLLTKLSKREKSNQAVKIRILQLTMEELSKDLLLVSELEHSYLFKKIYTEELDQAGGQPFGILLGDYYFSHTRKRGSDGIEVLQAMAKLSANALVPFVSSVSPVFFGLNSFSELQSPINVENIFIDKEYARWQSLREDENAHFIGLTLPRVLIREPYNKHGIKLKNRFFQEVLQTHEDYLWGNAAYLYVANRLECFLETGWFLNFQTQDANKKNKHNLLERDYFRTDLFRNISKISLECMMSDRHEKRLTELGFLPACDRPYDNKTLFYSNQSVKLARQQSTFDKTNTEKINTLLHYVLCASRFSQYIKVIVREKIGAFTNLEACEAFISKWLYQYSSSAKGQSLESISKKPLESFKLVIREIQGSPGNFFCSILINPHSQFDSIQSELKILTQIKLN